MLILKQTKRFKKKDETLIFTNVQSVASLLSFLPEGWQLNNLHHSEHNQAKQEATKEEDGDSV